MGAGVAAGSVMALAQSAAMTSTAYVVGGTVGGLFGAGVGAAAACSSKKTIAEQLGMIIYAAQVTYLSMIQKFEEKLRLRLPCSESVLHYEYQNFVDQLDQQIILTFPDGYNGFNQACNNVLEVAINGVKARITQENHNEFRQRLLRQYLTVLREQVGENIMCGLD